MKRLVLMLVAAASGALPVPVVVQVVSVPGATPVPDAVVCSAAVDTVHKLASSTPCTVHRAPCTVHGYRRERKGVASVCSGNDRRSR